MDLPAQGPDRRRFLQWGLAGLGLAAASPVLAACSSSGGTGGSGGAGDAGNSGAPSGTISSGSSSAAPAELTSLSVALSWIKDVTFAGDYIADSKGYYKDGGLKVNLIAGGGSSASPDAQLIAGQVQIAYTDAESTAKAVAQGADSRIVGCLYKKNPLAIISLESAPMTKPADLKGKRIGVNGTGEVTLDYFLKVNDLSKDDVKVVPANYDPTILATGDVDGYLGYFFDEPNTLREAGHPATAMLLGDFGYKGMSQTFAVSADALKNKRDLLKAYFIAEIKGWKDNIADPALGTQLTMQYGKDAGLKQQHQVSQNKDQLVLVSTPPPLFEVSEQDAKAAVDTLAATGTKTTVDALFDLTLLAEIYAEHPELAK